jgi:hypothetical protein
MLRLVVFLALFAGVVYATFWLIERRNKRRHGGGGTKPIKRGPVGPDDDEDFLRELERRRRHEKRQRDAGTTPGKPAAPGKPGPGPRSPAAGTPPPQPGSAAGPEANGGHPDQASGKDEATDKPVDEPVKGEAAKDEES